MYGYMYWRIGREESISAWAQGAFRCLLVFTVRWSFVFLPARREGFLLKCRWPEWVSVWGLTSLPGNNRYHLLRVGKN